MSDTLAGLPLHSEASADALADALAARVADALRHALAERGAASLVVSGGSTPAPMFDALAREPLDWSRVGVTLADERAVPVQHADSNERMVRERLLVGPAAAARFTSLYRPDGDLQRVGVALQGLARPFDVVLLGMGTDAHTASLFSDAPELELGMTTEGPLAAMHPPSQPLDRISLVRAALLDCRHCWLHVTGAAKRDVLVAAMEQWRVRGDGPEVPPVGARAGRRVGARRRRRRRVLGGLMRHASRRRGDGDRAMGRC